MPLVKTSPEECPRLVTGVMNHIYQHQGKSREGYFQASPTTTPELPHPTAFLLTHLLAEWLEPELKVLWPLSRLLSILLHLPRPRGISNYCLLQPLWLSHCAEQKEWVFILPSPTRCRKSLGYCLALGCLVKSHCCSPCWHSPDFGHSLLLLCLE